MRTIDWLNLSIKLCPGSFERKKKHHMLLRDPIVLDTYKEQILGTKDTRRTERKRLIFKTVFFSYIPFTMP